MCYDMKATRCLHADANLLITSCNCINHYLSNYYRNGFGLVVNCMFSIHRVLSIKNIIIMFTTDVPNG